MIDFLDRVRMSVAPGASYLACVGVADGERKWQGGRFGHSQLILLRDQDVLLVLSEQGELALVEAKPDRFTEVARFPAIEGRTRG
ncbi:MAG: hypothetical protein GY708_30815 [Actinomycetia bacterium]|nr:hypothetical protein [Actinomycetes bacterium]